MDEVHRMRLRRISGQLGDIAYEVTRIHFSHSSASDRWKPAMNVYRCEERLILCLDLAGVDPRDVEVEIQPKRLVLRGTRNPPEPNCKENKVLQVLAMEIDYGRFRREFALPFEVAAGKITQGIREGFLWIELPLKTH